MNNCRQSFSVRQSLLKTNITIFDYSETLPALKRQEGAESVCDDSFNYLFIRLCHVY